MIRDILKDVLNEAEKEFWERVEKFIGHLDPFICIILIANGYTSLYSFEGVNITEEFNSLQEQVNEIQQESRFYAEIKKLSPMAPPHMKLGQGHKNSLKHIFDKLSSCDKAKFYEDKGNEITGESSTDSGQPSCTKRNSKGQKWSDKLNPDIDYQNSLEEKALAYMKIADPDFVPTLSLKQTFKSAVKQVYEMKCCYCDFPMSLGVYQSNGYTRFDLKALETHYESRHENLANRFKAHKEQIQAFLLSHDIADANDDNLISELLPIAKVDGKMRMEIEFLLNQQKNKWQSNNNLNKYVHQAELTNKRGKSGNKFDGPLLPLKNFCTYLYIKSGASAYKAIYNNSVIPSQSTIKKEISKIPKFEIGKLHLEYILDLLKEKKYKDVREISISEDATRLAVNISYDPRTDELVGLVPEYDLKIGLPKEHFFKASSPSKIMEFLKNYNKAPYLQIIIAKPLKLGSPSRVIGVFPTDNKYDKNIVITRWKYIASEFEKHGYSCRFASDADPRLLGAMKILCEFGATFEIAGMCIKLIVNKDSDLKCISDIFHLLNNFKNRINDPTNSLMFGKYFVSMNFLKILVDHPEISRLEHGLCKSDVGTYDYSKDRMNTESTRKICEIRVIEALKKIPGSKGTVIYLQLMRDLYDAFICPETDDLTRLKKAFRVLCVIRIWRNNTPRGKRNNFLTNVNWACLELNITFLLDLILKGKGKLVTIWNSQPCEEAFRTLRSMGTFKLTQINMTVPEAIERLSRLNKIDEICFNYKKIFKFPEYQIMRSDKKRERNESHSENDSETDSDSTNDSEENFDLSIVRVEPPDENVCFEIIAEALQEAREICESVGMSCLEPCDPIKFFKTDHNSKNDVEEDDIEGNSEENYDLEYDDENLDDYLRNAYGCDEGSDETEEFNFLDDAVERNLEQRILKFKNLHFLDDETTEKFFIQCNEKGENQKQIRKSTFLWLLQEEKEKVSTDRIERFKNGKKEIVGERVVSAEKFYIDKSLMFGDCVVFRKHQGQKSTLFVGQVIGFEKKGVSKKERKFPFSHCIPEINRNLLIKLSPCYEIIKSQRLSGSLKECSINSFDVSHYVASSQLKYFDFENLIIEKETMRKMRSAIQ